MLMRLVLIAAFISSLLLSVLLTALMKKLAPAFRLLDLPGGRKDHLYPVPQGGGVAIFLSTTIVLLAISLFVAAHKFRAGLLPVPEFLSHQIGLAAGTLPMLLYITAGGAVIALLGLLDDVRPLSPGFKIASQLLIISVLVLSSGLRITLFINVTWVQMLITIMWITFLTNAFNLLDNMDGLSSSVALACGFALLICAVLTQQYFVAGLLLCLLGSVLGFFFFNLPPASIFMGDSGSMFIGYMLAAVSVLTTFIEGPHAGGLKPILVPLLIFALPLYDTCSVMLIRFRRGKPLFQGDTNHLSHRLKMGGMPERNVLLTVTLIAAASSLGATVPYSEGVWLLVIPSIQVLCLMLVLMQLEIWG